MNKSKIIICILSFILFLQLIHFSKNLLISTSSNSASLNWGLGYNNGSAPTGTTNNEELKKYNAYYLDKTGEKNIYLTFDAGYENGYTSTILDTLKEKKVPAAFFLVSHYFTSAPDLVKRMENEGHIIGNHTMKHPMLSQIVNTPRFEQEIYDLENIYKEITGKDMKKFIRPPSGNYSINVLNKLSDMGYSTIFWSMAYVDWDENNQPTHTNAYDTLMKRLHPGAILLLHSTSKTNSEILGDLIDKIKSEGYTFRSLDYLSMQNKKLDKKNNIEKDNDISNNTNITQSEDTMQNTKLN